MKAELQLSNANADKSHEEASKFKALYEDSEKWKSETAVAFRNQLEKLEKEFLSQRNNVLSEFERNKEMLERQREIEIAKLQQRWEELEQVEISRKSRTVAGVYTQTDERGQVQDAVDLKQNDLMHDEENLRLSAEINGLRAEACSLQEELMRKDEILNSLEKTLTQVASKDGSKNQASATALSKQVIAAKVAETDANRKLKRALQTEQELRLVIAQKDGTIQQLQQTQNLFFSRNDHSNKSPYDVAGSQEIPVWDGGGTQHKRSEGKSPQQLLDWLYVLDNNLDKQSSSEQVFIQTLWDLNNHSEIPPNILSNVKSQLVEQIAQKSSLRTFVAELNKKDERSEFAPICASLHSRVQQQISTLYQAEREMQSILLHGEKGANQAHTRSSQETLKELNIANSKRAPVKIKEPVKERYEKEMNSLKQKMLEASTKHVLEVDKLKRQLVDARMKIDALNLERRAVRQQTVSLQADLATIVQEYEVQLKFLRIHINDAIELQQEMQEMREEGRHRSTASEGQVEASKSESSAKGNESKISPHESSVRQEGVLELHQEIHGLRVQEDSYKKRIRELEHELSDVKMLESNKGKPSGQPRVSTHDAELEMASRRLKELDSEVKMKESMSKLNVSCTFTFLEPLKNMQKTKDAIESQLYERNKENSLLQQKLDGALSELRNCKMLLHDRNKFSTFATQIQKEASQIIREIASVTSVVEKQFLFHREILHDKNSQVYRKHAATDRGVRGSVEERFKQKLMSRRIKENENIMTTLRAEREELFKKCDVLSEQLEKKNAESSIQMRRFQEELNHYKKFVRQPFLHQLTTCGREQEALEQEYLAQIENQRKKLSDTESALTALNGEVASLRRYDLTSPGPHST
eukprot:751672-Hanusia_phi.AAC.3